MELTMNELRKMVKETISEALEENGQYESASQEEIEHFFSKTQNIVERIHNDLMEEYGPSGPNLHGAIAYTLVESELNKHGLTAKGNWKE